MNTLGKMEGGGKKKGVPWISETTWLLEFLSSAQLWRAVGTALLS